MVGLGPGDASCLTPMAAEALASAGVVAGYGTYLDLVSPELLAGKRIVSTGMTGEVARCERAVDEALAGRDVVVVSGGDAGVYGMSGLVLEILEARGLLDRIDFSVVPGVPALTAAAALLGAPLMHDFAVVSLSDLLTPWEAILARIEAAAAADFVTVLYNPRSKRRVSQLEEAAAVLAKFRSWEAPVGLVRKAFRPDCLVRTFPLKMLDYEAVDMVTILIVGNSRTRMAGNRLLTPRGYDGKYRLG